MTGGAACGAITMVATGTATALTGTAVARAAAGGGPVERVGVSGGAVTAWTCPTTACTGGDTAVTGSTAACAGPATVLTGAATSCTASAVVCVGDAAAWTGASTGGATALTWSATALSGGAIALSGPSSALTADWDVSVASVLVATGVFTLLTPATAGCFGASSGVGGAEGTAGTPFFGPPAARLRGNPTTALEAVAPRHGGSTTARATGATTSLTATAAAASISAAATLPTVGGPRGGPARARRALASAARAAEAARRAPGCGRRFPFVAFDAAASPLPAAVGVGRPAAAVPAATPPTFAAEFGRSGVRTGAFTEMETAEERRAFDAFAATAFARAVADARRARVAARATRARAARETRGDGAARLPAGAGTCTAVEDETSGAVCATAARGVLMPLPPPLDATAASDAPAGDGGVAARPRRCRGGGGALAARRAAGADAPGGDGMERRVLASSSRPRLVVRKRRTNHKL